MTAAGTISSDRGVSIIHQMLSRCVMLFIGSLIGMIAPILLGRVRLYDLHHSSMRFPDMTTPQSCLGGMVAVDTEGHPCMSLEKLTDRTFIHRASTADTTYMYCPVPKNRCSYHIDMLHRVNGDYFAGSSKHTLENKDKIINTDQKEAATLLSDSSILRYMVIRNLMSRTLSGYLCKVERYIPEIEVTPVTFRRWVREQFTNLASWEKVNNQWRAQTEFCGYGMRDVQKNSKCSDWKSLKRMSTSCIRLFPSRILETVWGENSSNFRDFMLSPYKRTGRTEAKFSEYVRNHETFDLLERTFRKNIDTLGAGDGDEAGAS